MREEPTSWARDVWAGVILALALAFLPVPPTAAQGPLNPTAGVAALPESYPWVKVAEAAMPAVVNVRTSGEGRRARGPSVPEPFRRFFPDPEEGGPRGGGPRRGLGSGFIVDPNGLIVTNHHVIDGAASVEVTLSDGRTLPAKRVGSDPETDLALLRIEATGLPTMPLGSSAALRVAEPVMAIGNPFGLDHTVTVGIISGTSRVIGAGRFDDFLQTDAAINPGNSGGPLLNTRGEVVGINSAIASRTGGFQGVGFAIPIDLAKPIIRQLQASGKVIRGWLGVTIQPLTAELAKSFGLSTEKGALVASVNEDSPAARAGLKPGDVIVRFEGKPVDSPRVLPTLVANTDVGRNVDLGIIRDGAEQTVGITVGNLADSREARAAGGASEGRAAERAGLELQELTPALARRLGVREGPGVVITDVKADSPAAKAGLETGDVIREVNRRPVKGLEDLERGLASPENKGQALLRVERDGSQRYLLLGVG